MFMRNRTTRAGPAHVVLLLCATLTTDVAMAAPPTLQSIAVTPAASSISVGQRLFFKATGTFSNGSTHVLGAAIANIAPGALNTCVLLTSGGVKCWGNNWYGELGDGSTNDSLIPRRVKGINTAKAVASAWNHGCAVLARGAVQCWGQDLSRGSNYNFVSALVTGISSATAVSLGWAHNCALLVDGAIRCWGYNEFGELGDGTTKEWSGVPVWVTGITTAIAVATGESHNCAVLNSGEVRCWGQNWAGQLGDGTTTDSNTPVTVIGIDSATAVAAGQLFSCALLSSGAAKCWGWNAAGSLGNGSSAHYSSIPVFVSGISTAVAITAGSNHACAVLSSGAAQCWGDNSRGELGNAYTYPISSTPVRVMEINAPVKLAAGSEHTCALLADGAMRCWGWNNEGQLGNRRTTGSTPNLWPVNVIGTPGVFWQSSDPSKATIIPSGRATARSIGNTTITATTAGFINDNAVLTVK